MTEPAEVLVELDRDGTIENEWSLMELVDEVVFDLEVPAFISYRSERVPSLYTGPLWDTAG